MNLLNGQPRIFLLSTRRSKQAGLIIEEANGAVTQDANRMAEIYTGKAEISGASGTILSYDTTSYRPTTQPATKSITPNVKITVTWNNGGGVDVYYGYVSYSQRLALTDGIAVTTRGQRSLAFIKELDI